MPGLLELPCHRWHSWIWNYAQATLFSNPVVSTGCQNAQSRVCGFTHVRVGRWGGASPHCRRRSRLLRWATKRTQQTDGLERACIEV